MTSPPLVQALHQVLAPHAKVIACAYLFGSQARNEAGPHSDVDVAVLYRQEPPLGLDGLGLDLAAALERALGRPVDLVILNRASPDLVHRILRDGILILESDASARIRFETKARAEYFDILPYLREYRRGPGKHHDRP